MIDRRSPMPLYVQLKDEIQKRIKDGIYQIDTQIPTEKELMETYNLGRATVREAIARLVSEGYLYKKHGIGTFVARKEPALGFEPLISLTYSLKVRGVNPSNVIEKKDFIIPDKKLLKKLKWKKEKNCFYMKRLRFAEDIPIAIEESYFDAAAAELLKSFDLNGSLAKIILEEIKITIDMVEQVIVPRKPTPEEERILKIDESVLVLDMERWIYANNQKEPYYYLRFIIPNNIYTYPLEDVRKD